MLQLNMIVMVDVKGTEGDVDIQDESESELGRDKISGATLLSAFLHTPVPYVPCYLPKIPKYTRWIISINILDMPSPSPLSSSPS